MVLAGGSPVGEDEWALGFGTDAQPAARYAANRQKTTAATGPRGSARAPGSEFKMQVLRYVRWAERSSSSRHNCRVLYSKRNIAVY